VRYNAILIDPFSKPNEEGAYFDFFAVPYKCINADEQGVIHVPHMPSEDYYRTLMIQAIGRVLNIHIPMIDTFLLRYEDYLYQYRTTHPNQNLSTQFEQHHFDKNLVLVTQFLKSNFK